jgi:hypothetical protein
LSPETSIPVIVTLVGAGRAIAPVNDCVVNPLEEPATFVAVA